MRIILHLPDGGREVRRVDEITLELNKTTLNLSMQSNPIRLVLNAPGTDERWFTLGVLPCAANVIAVEAHMHKRRHASKRRQSRRP